MEKDLEIISLDDSQVKTQSLEDKIEVIATEIKTTGVKNTTFRFYMSDSFAKDPNTWHCEVMNDTVSATINVCNYIDDEKCDMDALLGRFLLAAQKVSQG